MRCVITELLPGGIETLESAPETILQRVVLNCDIGLRALYWAESDGSGCDGSSSVRATVSGSMVIPAGTCVAFGGYFSGFPEFAWRENTRLATLSLRLRLEGRARVTVLRWAEPTGRTVLWQDELDGATTPIRIDVPHPGASFRLAGRLAFEITAIGDAPVVLHAAEYVARHTPVEPVGLALILCTFNRERALGAVLSRIAGDAALTDSLSAVIVVNQGRPGLREHSDVRQAAGRLGSTLRVIEQANFGGAGGFSRGLLAALDDPSLTHGCFVDDDVIVEPESLRRIAAFFRIADPTLCVGGHMLDAIQPTILYEAGAVVDRRNWRLTPLHFHRDLREPAVLQELPGDGAMDYNGWWLFGFPLGLVRKIGMPLPCFIRGDDVEFGLRLQRNGYATVSIPGIAVWHEPFYLKLGDWQLYYEVRNQLVAASLHFDLRGPHAALLVCKHLLIYLLTFRYLSAALIVRGLADFLAGPTCLENDPTRNHAAIMALKQRYPEERAPRRFMIRPLSIPRSPHGVTGFAWALTRVLLRHLVVATRSSDGPSYLLERDLVWFRVGWGDAVAVDSYWSRELIVFRRSRAHARAIMAEAVPLLWRLLVRGRTLAQLWRHAAPRLTAESFWRDYLALPPHQ